MLPPSKKEKGVHFSPFSLSQKKSPFFGWDSYNILIALNEFYPSIVYSFLAMDGVQIKVWEAWQSLDDFVVENCLCMSFKQKGGLWIILAAQNRSFFFALRGLVSLKVTASDTVPNMIAGLYSMLIFSGCFGWCYSHSNVIRSWFVTHSLLFMGRETALALGDHGLTLLNMLSRQ